MLHTKAQIFTFLNYKLKENSMSGHNNNFVMPTTNIANLIKSNSVISKYFTKNLINYHHKSNYCEYSKIHFFVFLIAYSSKRLKILIVNYELLKDYTQIVLKLICNAKDAYLYGI